MDSVVAKIYIILSDTTILLFILTRKVHFRIKKGKHLIISVGFILIKLEFIKNPLIAEFLGFSLEDTYTETELETSIINNLQKFLMELRKRICFCGKATTYSY